MVFTASLLGAEQKKNSVENKLASLLVVSLGKTLNRMPPSLGGKQVAGPNSLLSWWPSYTEDQKKGLIRKLIRFLISPFFWSSSKKRSEMLFQKNERSYPYEEDRNLVITN